MAKVGGEGFSSVIHGRKPLPLAFKLELEPMTSVPWQRSHCDSSTIDRTLVFVSSIVKIRVCKIKYKNNDSSFQSAFYAFIEDRDYLLMILIPPHASKICSAGRT